MEERQLDQLIDGPPADQPQPVVLRGSFVTLAPVDPVIHAPSLHEASRGPEAEDLWRYLLDSPPVDLPAFESFLASRAGTGDRLDFAILENRFNQAVGLASYLAIDPAHRRIEVGSILYTPRLQRTPGGTEAMYLMARHAFELGYRRYEWKCNALNQPSRRAALRYGFEFEGIFRQHMVLKGRNRDTAWLSMLDGEWPARRAAFERWLDPSNFNPDGSQRTPLSASDASPQP